MCFKLPSSQEVIWKLHVFIVFQFYSFLWFLLYEMGREGKL